MSPYLRLNIGAQLDEVDWAAGAIDPSKVHEAVRRIAAAVILTGEAEVHLTGAERGFDPMEVLPDWPQENVLASDGEKVGEKRLTKGTVGP